MTDEELRVRAIQELEFYKKDDTFMLADITVDLAIEALEQEPKTDSWSIKDVADTFKKHGLIRVQEPSGNAINRKLVCTFIDGLISDDVEREKGLEYIRNMPSVNPTKTGHWEQYGNSWEDKFKCSECGKEQPKILCGERIIGHWSDYCPNCGARMVEPQERSDNE